MVVCQSHCISGVVHVSGNIATRMKNAGTRLEMFRYDIDWLGDGSVGISYFVSKDVAKQSGLPEPGAVPFDLEFEEGHATVFDALVAVCDRCFDEYWRKTT